MSQINKSESPSIVILFSLYTLSNLEIEVGLWIKSTWIKYNYIHTEERKPTVKIVTDFFLQPKYPKC